MRKSLNMKSILSKKIATAGVAGAILVGGAAAAQAVTFGTAQHGASSVEVFQVRYDGKAWNYPGSGHSGVWFKYSRDGVTKLYRETRFGETKGSVWDNLTHWGQSQTTVFSWGSK